MQEQKPSRAQSRGGAEMRRRISSKKGAKLNLLSVVSASPCTAFHGRFLVSLRVSAP